MTKHFTGCMLIAVSLSFAAETITVTPKDTGAALVNPDMGWTMHFYSNVPTNYGSKLEPSDTLDDFPGLSTVYLRVPWAMVEPEEGQFNWALLDTPAQRWIAKGKRAAFRITCSENWTENATPDWVRKAGAKVVNYTWPKGPDPNGKNWDPVFDDPIFLEKLDHFLAAMSARYNGNPNIAFIDIGTFGMWGEGHTFGSSRIPEDKADPIVRKHIDLHAKHFPATLLCISDDVVGPQKPGRHFPLLDYAISKGVSLRDDSICVQPPPHSWYHSEMAQEFWPKFPVILEHEHYGSSKQRKAWGDGSLLLKSVEDYHAAYMSIHWWPREELEENRAIIDRINQRMGYRLVPREITWPKKIASGKRFTVTSKWSNAGVAPCYPGGFMALTLKDARAGIASVLVDEKFNMRDLSVGPSDQAPVSALESSFLAGHIAPVLRPGSYDVFVSVGRRDGTPVIALPLDGDDGQRRYRIGTLQVCGDYSVQAGALEKRGDQWLLPLTWTIHRPAVGAIGPFFHFDDGGKIAFQGGPEDGAKAGVLAQTGTVKLGCEFKLPRDARGRKFTVHVGLWQPDRLGRPDERLLPDNGQPDKRVLLGTINVAQDGDVTFTPEP
ncbi:MAG TPA: DUF4832 domain-containing protein [Planctomycetota bacterium]|jgi:hypothetical protein